MKQIEYLLIMRDSWDDVASGEEIRVTVGELAGILHNSIRNVNYLLKKMHDSGEITWSPGRGRGNVSKLTFRYSFHEIVSMYITAMSKEQKISEIIAFNESSSLSQKNKLVMYQHLHEALGPQIVHTSSGRESVLSFLLPQQINTLDPISAKLYSEAHIIGHVYQTLVNFNSASGRLEPGLAYAWKEGNAGKSWKFLLRKGVRFHHLEELTAQDVKYTFNRILESGRDTAIYPLLRMVHSIEISDRYSVIFHLEKANTFFPRILASFHCSVLYHQHQPTAPIGTGPFRVREQKERFLSLTAFDYFYRERALIDRIDIWSSSQFNHHGIKKPAGEESALSISNVHQLPGSRLIAFNLHHGDSHFRLAVTKLCNPQMMVAELQGNRSMPASSFLPVRSKDAQFPPGSLDEIKSLLGKSSYSGEELKLFYFNLNEGRESAEWIKRRGELVGLHISLFPIPMEPGNAESVRQEADLLLLSMILGEDVELSLYTIYKSDHSFLRAYLPLSVTAYIDAQLLLVEEDQTGTRLQTLMKIEQYLKENLHIHFLYHAHIQLNYAPYLKGVEMTSYGLVHFAHLWIDPDSETVTSGKNT